MRSILEELFYGNICPNTDRRSHDKETKQLMGYIADHHDNLLTSLAFGLLLLIVIVSAFIPHNWAMLFNMPWFIWASILDIQNQETCAIKDINEVSPRFTIYSLSCIFSPIIVWINVLQSVFYQTIFIAILQIF